PRPRRSAHGLRALGPLQPATGLQRTASGRRRDGAAGPGAAGAQRLETDRLRRPMSTHRTPPLFLRPHRARYGARRSEEAHATAARARLRRPPAGESRADGDVPKAREVDRLSTNDMRAP